MRTINYVSTCLVLILCGCATQPAKPARKVPMPPLLPGMNEWPKGKKTATIAPRVAFVPAAVTTGPAVFINGYHVIAADPPFPAYTNAFVAADQLSNNVLSIRMNTVPTGDPATWAEPARFDCYPSDNLVAVSISITDPLNHHFRSINTPCPATFAPASAELATPTDKTLVVRGKTYRLVALKRAGESINKVQRFRLVPK